MDDEFDDDEEMDDLLELPEEEWVAMGLPAHQIALLRQLRDEMMLE